MFDVIDALEVLGADADLVGASSVSLDAVLRRELETLLRAPMSRCILIHPAEEEEIPEEEDEEGEDDGDEEEDEVESRKSPKPRPS